MYSTFECVASPALIPLLLSKHILRPHTYNTSSGLPTKEIILLYPHSPRMHFSAKEPCTEAPCNNTSGYPNTLHPNHYQNTFNSYLRVTHSKIKAKIYKLNLFRNFQLVILLIAFLLLTHSTHALESGHNNKPHTPHTTKNGQVT